MTNHTPSGAPLVFDRNRHRLHRDRAARLIASGQSDDFLYVEIAQRLADCLEDVKRSFPRVLDLGCRAGHLLPMVKHKCGDELYLQTDFSPYMAELARKNGQPTLVVDEEDLTAIGAYVGSEKFDLVLAGGGLHWVNDLPGTFQQIKNLLKPDGLFLGACLSGDTLGQARTCMLEVEQNLMGGVSPRFSPGFELADAAALLQRAGFALPVADLSSLHVGHSSGLKLVQDLRAMGETNAHMHALKTCPPRALLPSFFATLADQATDSDLGQISTRFDLMVLTGWVPDPSQQQPLKPGTASTSFLDVLE